MISKGKIKLIKSLEHKKYRDKESLFVAEGHKVVGEMKKAFRCVETFDEEDDVRKITFMQHPQGIVGIFEKPQQDKDEYEIDPSRLYLALDKIQDPGNLGTIIRIADWFGIDTIFCSADTVDCWSPKVVQATMGSLARVKVVYCDLCQLIEKSRKKQETRNEKQETRNEVAVYGTFLDGDNIYNESLTPNGIIVMGNEGNGISEAVRNKITHRLLIPATRPGAESLNVAVATAITLSEFRRQTFRLADNDNQPIADCTK